MPRPSNNDIEQDKLARFDRIKKAIAQLEKQQRQILKQGELAPEAAWVARYQVRQLRSCTIVNKLSECRVGTAQLCLKSSNSVGEQCPPYGY